MYQGFSLVKYWRLLFFDTESLSGETDNILHFSGKEEEWEITHQQARAISYEKGRMAQNMKLRVQRKKPKATATQIHF